MQLIVNNEEMLGKTTDKALHLALIEKDKEIERLSKEVTKYDEILGERNNEFDRLYNIINELEKSILQKLEFYKNNKDYFIDEKTMEDLYIELKQLKEGKK